ncbi:unnamed protein product [Ambrosiozyma monospora]|uniref:Unnamed protein product n=1 Tax=Ambrosiozyma monospora TaxID=43982 RepID=A0ACB5TE89_AMBMO|nr:unnamed protein product [Ambrosiozyma monospora]
MLASQLLISTILSLTGSSVASPIANPKAESFAVAEAVGFAIPADADPASYECHAFCGNAILAARACSSNGADDGTFDSTCLCASDSEFMSYVPDCLDCGWCLWDDYGSYLTTPLSTCDQPTEPTGTACAA